MQYNLHVATVQMKVDKPTIHVYTMGTLYHGDPHASIRQGNNSRSTNSAVFPVSEAVKAPDGILRTTSEHQQLSMPR